MKLKLSILFLLLSLNSIAQLPSLAQDSVAVKKHTPPPPPKFFDPSKMYTGGNFGLQFGTITFIDLSPLIGYRVTDKISVGVGITYQYYRYKSSSYDFQTNVYGGRVFARYFIRKNLFAHTEYEILNLQAYDLYPPQRVNVGSLLVGGGYIQRFGNSSGFTAMILYNLTPSTYTPYQNPIIRMGMIIGF